MPLSDYALCVGINAYPGLKPLQGAEADAAAFAVWVQQVAQVPAANCTLILSSHFAPAFVANQAQPTSQKIWDFFERLRTEVAANGSVAGRRLYLFFAGHGVSYSVDTSSVLMANAERDTPHNVSAKAWADRLYENGYFEEILLFQDACREAINDLDPTPPYLKRSPMSGWQKRRRFYAFAAKSPLLALETPTAGGDVRGVFSATLMAGLYGGACDPLTGQINTLHLKSYLQANMRTRLSQAQLDDEEISQQPEVIDPDLFVILPGPLPGASPAVPPGAPPGASPVVPPVGAAAVAPPVVPPVVPPVAPPAVSPVAPPVEAAAQPRLFPVQVQLAPPGQGAEIRDGARRVAANTPPGVTVWNLDLPLGFYELVAEGHVDTLFKVSGALTAGGDPEVVHVA